MKKSEKDWEQRRYYMGLDWAKEYHEIVLLDSDGRIMLDLRIEHTAEGWRHLREKLVDLAGPNLPVVAATIETNHGPAVERLSKSSCHARHTTERAFHMVT